MGSSTAILCCNRGRRPRQFALFGELELIARLRARAVERLANVCRFRAAQDGEELRERPKTRSPYERSLAFAWDDGRGASVNPVQQEISAFFASSAVNRTGIDDLGYRTLLSRASKRS